MSSLRNAVKRVTHKERSQPQARSHLGILEKKSDFIERAKNYHIKTKTLQNLRTKASQKNPDEFYFGMIHSKVNSNTGKHEKTLEARHKELEHLIGDEAVRIMKDQDLSYIRMQIQKDQKKEQKLHSSLHYLISDPSTATSSSTSRNDRMKQTFRKNKHTVFVNDETQMKNFDIATHFDTVPEIAERAFNRPRIKTLLRQQQQELANSSMERALTEKQQKKQNKLNKKFAKRIAKARLASYHELEARQTRKSMLQKAEAHLVTEKLIHSKGRKRKIKEAENGNPAVYKWRRKRSS